MSLLYAGMNALNKVEINALLLSALARAINELFDINRTHIFMEGHGREEHIDDVDVSRTIGWFTSIYPFELNCENQDITSVFSLQDSLDKVPNKGVGYGLLNYLNDNLSYYQIVLLLNDTFFLNNHKYDYRYKY